MAVLPRDVIPNTFGQFLLVQLAYTTRVFFLGVRVTEEGCTTVFRKELRRRCIPADLHVAQLTELPGIEVGGPIFGQDRSQEVRLRNAYRTKLIWTPMFLWTLEQSRQIYTPNVTLDHVGFRAPQSKQDWSSKDFFLGKAQ